MTHSNRTRIPQLFVVLLAALVALGACSKRPASRYGAVVDNAGGIKANASGLDFNNHKGLNVTNGTSAQDVAAFGQIAGTRLDQFAVPTADVSLNSHKITSLADGVSSSDGAAFHQIGDAVLAGRAVACDALTTSNQATLSGLAQTIDGVALSSAGMRACTFGQTTVTQDGCYVVASGAWTRCTDLPTGANASNRSFTTVAGTSNKGVWSIQPGSNVVGTNDLVVVNQTPAGGSITESQLRTAASGLTAALAINNQSITGGKNFVYNSELDDGNSGTALTVDWSTGGNHKVTLTGNVTFTFTAPAGPTNLQLKLVQDGTGSRTVTAWPGTVKWSGGSPPILTTTATTGTDLVSCWYDGTSYWCVAALGFS